MKPVMSLNVLFHGRKVGELIDVPGRGVFFGYDPQWLAKGFNLAPFHLSFTEQPQLAADTQLFGGLHGPFSDSVPDGWGQSLLARYFQSRPGLATRQIGVLDRLAYMGSRGMGALEYAPALSSEPEQETVSLACLFDASRQVLSGSTAEVLDALYLVGGSAGGVMPKVVVGLSDDGHEALASFSDIPFGFAQWLVKFHGQNETDDTGAIERAYAKLAVDAGLDMAESDLLTVDIQGGPQRFFATRRFDRVADRKVHMLSASAILYADHREPSLDYGDLLRATWAMTHNAAQVEKMARLMVFNALGHNRNDHAKNFSFLGDQNGWTVAPAYDLTFSSSGRRGNEHTTSFAGSGKPTRAAIHKVCEPFSFLKPDLYIEQTLHALAGVRLACEEFEVSAKRSASLQLILGQVWKQL